ncbi:extensin-like [Mercurialis annua]|uniref:extensin-like n=1 Tax=Mercurialis annua TaxID=3986 RepID=UPI0024AF7564|nr:extensin-like [Mercurialis annua]
MYLTGRHIWRARVPMIYYHIVEWHQPDRVLQQFGLQQPIPLPAMQDRRLHNIQYQGSYNFDELLSDYIQIWNNRAAYVVQGYQLQRPPHYHSAYMEWFRSRSRRWITHEGAAAGQSRDTFEMIALQREARASRIGTAARSSQLAYGEERRDVTLPPPEPAVPAYVLPPLPPLTIDLAHIRGARRRQPRAAPPRERPADPIPPPVYFHFDPTATTDRRGEYYGPTQYYGSTSASQPPWHQTYFPQGPQVSSYQVPPSSMPFFEPSYGQTAYTTSLGTPPASQFQQATPPASQFRQTTPPASPFQQTTPPPFAASDQYYRPAPYTDAQPFTSFDQCYRPTMPSDDQPSTSHSRPSSSHQAQDPSQLHFTLSESWLFGPEIGSEAYEELLSRPDLTPPSFRLLPPTQEETGTAPPAADVQHSAQDEDASDSGESPPVPRQFHSITDSSRHRQETHGLRVQRPRTRRYED